MEVELVEDDVDAGRAEALGEGAYAVALCVGGLAVADEDVGHGRASDRSSEEVSSPRWGEEV
jgi:hypothetical protein